MINRIRHICSQHFSQKEGWLFLIAWTALVSISYLEFRSRQTEWDFPWWLLIGWSLFCIAYLTLPQWKLISIRFWLILTSILFTSIFNLVLTIVYFLFLTPIYFIKNKVFTDRKTKNTNWVESRIENKDYTSMG